MESESKIKRASDAAHCSPSSETPRTDGKVAHVESKGVSSHSRYQSMIKFSKKLELETAHSRRMQKKLADNVNERIFERDKAIAEIKRWKDLFVPFAIIHAANYGRDHYGDLCMHFTHYDLLEEAGARMDDFKRCGAPILPENASVEARK